MDQIPTLVDSTKKTKSPKKAPRGERKAVKKQKRKKLQSPGNLRIPINQEPNTISPKGFEVEEVELFSD